MLNKKGAASMESVFVGMAVIFILHLLANVTFFIISGTSLLVSAETDIKKRFSKIRTPCLEKYSDGDFKNGRHGRSAKIGAEQIEITREIIFSSGEICN